MQHKQFWAECVAATARREPDRMVELIFKKLGEMNIRNKRLPRAQHRAKRTH
jgi:hypothetical protein